MVLTFAIVLLIAFATGKSKNSWLRLEMWNIYLAL